MFVVCSVYLSLENWLNFYSLFVSDNLGEQPTKCSPEEDEEDEEDVDDEDHDEGFGSEHELSENEEEEEEEEDYEDDKDDDISDTFSEPGIILFGGLPSFPTLLK